MHTPFQRSNLLLATLIVASAGTAARAVAPSIAAGYDLEATKDGTQFAGVPLTGVPLGAFNFGGSIGTQSVGDADTIVQRLGSTFATTIPGPGNAPVNSQLDALQLVTTVPANFGLGVGIYYVTLQSVRGGPASSGQTNVNFDTGTSGTFTSFFDVFFDIRLGSLNGPIALSNDAIITNSGTPWQNDPPEPLDVLINGANHNLNGTSTANDFWPVGNITHSGTGETHVVGNAMTPEPGMLSALAIGAMTLRRRGARLG